jgi:L,D-transpeptidase ErfK/SrfK
MRLRVFACSVFLLSFLFFQVQPTASAQPEINSLVGKNETIVMQRGDTLYRIARHFDMSMSDLVRANGRKAMRLKAGESLRIPGRRIVPTTARDGILLNVPERRLYLFRNGELLQTHAVAVGKPDWQTAIGSFHVARLTKNPVWTPPRSMIEREGVKDDPVPPGPENPLGDRWIGWSASGFGFHSTNSPRSIGGVVSHGCVRLYPEQAKALFEAVSVGTPIHSVYEPVLLAREGGCFYLSVWPDIYKKGGTSLEEVEERLKQTGLIGAVDPEMLRRVVQRANGLPERIIGSDLKLEVNGHSVEMPIAPTFVDGRLVVPARAVVEAMGGKVTDQEGGAVKIDAPSKKLVITPGKPDAELNGISASIPIVPAVVADNLLIPLRTLLDLFGGEMKREGDVIKISTPLTRAVLVSRNDQICQCPRHEQAFRRGDDARVVQ